MEHVRDLLRAARPDGSKDAAPSALQGKSYVPLRAFQPHVAGAASPPSAGEEGQGGHEHQQVCTRPSRATHLPIHRAGPNGDTPK